MRVPRTTVLDSRYWIGFVLVSAVAHIYTLFSTFRQLLFIYLYLESCIVAISYPEQIRNDSNAPDLFRSVDLPRGGVANEQG